MKARVDKFRILPMVIFLVGLFVCSYPFVSNIIQRQYQKDAVATYMKAVDGAGVVSVETSLNNAHEYNDRLYQTNGLVVGTSNNGILSDENYNSLLNISGDGTMGSIEIPKINVNLPIYHGISDEVLAIGVGHVQDTSLPIGGINTRAVLSAHRGLPNSKLFTRLDEMEKGDLFFIRVLDDTLAYEVVDVDVIDPDDVEKLSILPERDLVTLLTCTPYGINTHRLIVTGERVEFEKATYESIEGEMMSFRELAFTFAPFAFLVLGIVTFLKPKKHKERVNTRIDGGR